MPKKTSQPARRAAGSSEQGTASGVRNSPAGQCGVVVQRTGFEGSSVAGAGFPRTPTGGKVRLGKSSNLGSRGADSQWLQCSNSGGYNVWGFLCVTMCMPSFNKKSALVRVGKVEPWQRLDRGRCAHHACMEDSSRVLCRYLLNLLAHGVSSHTALHAEGGELPREILTSVAILP